MKRGCLLIFKVLFTMTFFLGAGINAFSSCSISSVQTEVSSCTCNDENCICPDINSLNDDQICQSLYSPSDKGFCYIPLFKGTFLTQSFYFTVWQPPKIS